MYLLHKFSCDIFNYYSIIEEVSPELYIHSLLNLRRDPYHYILMVVIYSIDILIVVIYSNWYIDGCHIFKLIYWWLSNIKIDILMVVIYSNWFIDGCQIFKLINWWLSYIEIDTLMVVIYSNWYIDGCHIFKLIHWWLSNIQMYISVYYCKEKRKLNNSCSPFF